MKILEEKTMISPSIKDLPKEFARLETKIDNLADAFYELVVAQYVQLQSQEAHKKAWLKQLEDPRGVASEDDEGRPE